MTDDEGLRSVRRAIKGADRPIRLVSDPEGPPPVPKDDNGDRWPIMPLGHSDGIFYVLDVSGQKRSLTAHRLGSRHNLLSLTGGSDAFYRAQFPKQVEKNGAWITVDFRINDAAAAVQRACFGAGLFGEHIQLRPSGVYRDADGLPVVHCGDLVLLGNTWHPAGTRQGNQIFAAAPATPRPGIPCPADIARHLQAELTRLWRWRDGGAPTAIIGLIANAYYGAALDWRPAGFFTGETSSGKTELQNVIRAALLLHHYDNDTTKAGIEQAVHGRAMPIVIDEAADRANRNIARELADLVLSAASGEGTRGSRGTLDGKGRKIELAGMILMFSINPPDLEPQHLGRMTLIELLKPDEGADHRAQHRMLARYARVQAAALWARALASWERYQGALERFREGLRKEGCAPREMDQAGALLAGWWILVEEGLPDERGVAYGISALHGSSSLKDPGPIRGSVEIEADSRPKPMLQHLLASMVNLHRSSEREPVGKLIQTGWGMGDEARSPDDARELLKHYGIRLVLRCDRPGVPRPPGKDCDCPQCVRNKRPVPRMSEGRGVWFANQNPELKKLFAGTPFDGERWRYEMLRLNTARRSSGAVYFSGACVSNAVWIGEDDLPLDVEDRKT